MNTPRPGDRSLKLFAGTILRIMRCEKLKDAALQILGKKRIKGNLPDDVRYRLLVSDGGHLYSFAMMATQLNSQIPAIPDLSIIRVDRYRVYPNKEMHAAKNLWQPILVIFSFTVLVRGDVFESVIGKPVELILRATSAVNCQPTVSGDCSTPSPLRGSNVAMMQNTPKNNQSVSGAPITKIANIVRRYQRGWAIRARVVEKTEIKKFSNGRQFFSMTFHDNSSSIRAIVWDKCCDRYYDTVTLHELYNLSECKVDYANEKFNTTKHPFELHFTDKTLLVPGNEGDVSSPVPSNSFMPLHQIYEATIGTIVAVIGICISALDINAYPNGKETKIHELTIVDSTKTKVVLTVWRPQTELISVSGYPIISVRGGKIAEFKGDRKVNVLRSSSLVSNPSDPEALQLQEWRSSQEFQLMLSNDSLH